MIASLPDAGLPPIVSAEDWATAYQAMLTKEKELTRARDALAAERRKMPMTLVETDYRFVGPEGEVGLLDLFDNRRQLVVYRFFYEPDVAGWPDKACGGCSYFADHVPHLAHLNARDTTFVMVSPADQEKITALMQRMGWDVPWYTLLGDAFSDDFGVAEMFGLNVFLREDSNRVFRTYFVNARGVEPFTPTLSLFDITPLGRQETWEETPDGRPQTPPYNARRHDEYP